MALLHDQAQRFKDTRTHATVIDTDDVSPETVYDRGTDRGEPMSDSVQKIKERLSIVEVVQPYVKLTKAGKYWKGLSPFNKERTPSFFVSPDRGLYHCFSSGKGGDMFTFIEEMEGVDFKGALALLAEKAGVELVPEAPGRAR